MARRPGEGSPCPSQTVGVVLAGGSSRRMGCPKGAMRHPGGRTFLEEALHRLHPWTRFRVVVGHGPGEWVPPAIPWLRDPPGSAGPLAGIARVGAVFPADYYLVLAVDLPAARPDRLVAAARRHPGRAVVALAGDGAWQPLAGLYPRRDIRRALRLLQRGERRAMVWVRTGRPPPVLVPGACWANVNTPEEAERCLGAPFRSPFFGGGGRQ